MENLLFHNRLPILLLIGGTIIVSFYFGRSIKYLRLPSIIGFMLFGVILGPSLLNLMGDVVQTQLSFLTEMALGFVALTIGLELRFSTLRNLGVSIIYIILAESFFAFLFVFFTIWILSGNLPLALIFAAIAPASAPAGTVAVIQEFKARGSLTKALYAVVGFDDGLGIILFGFASAAARMILIGESGNGIGTTWMAFLIPMKEIAFSLVFGGLLAIIFALLARKLENAGDVLILVVGFILAACGLCKLLHLSLILTNMVVGIVIVNTQPHSLIQKIHDRLPLIMPLFFILFFTLAGSNLHLKALPALGVLGLLYVVARSAGLISGSQAGAWLGKAEKKIQKYLGLGILSQAGVAIGLALIVKQEFRGIGRVIETIDSQNITTGDQIGATVITTITATCIFFEIIGPILTKIALKKAGEIPSE